MTAIAHQNRSAQPLFTTKDQLLTIGDLESFKDEIFKEFRHILKECINNAPGKKWLKSCEVKKLLGISHGFLQSLRDGGLLPFTKIGGSIYYDYEDISFMMASHKSLEK